MEKSQQQENQSQQPQQVADKDKNLQQVRKTNSIICANADVDGDVKFGKGCIVNPGCHIIAEEGSSIIFGDYNIIEERCYIHNKASKDGSKKVMTVGSYNLFQVGCKIEFSEIGDMNQFEQRCQIDKGQIKSGCTIGATVKIPENTVLQSQSKIYYPDKVVKELNFDEESYKKNIMSLYDTLAILIPKGNPTKSI